MRRIPYPKTPGLVRTDLIIALSGVDKAARDLITSRIRSTFVGINGHAYGTLGEELTIAFYIDGVAVTKEYQRSVTNFAWGAASILGGSARLPGEY